MYHHQIFGLSLGYGKSAHNFHSFVHYFMNLVKKYNIFIFAIVIIVVRLLFHQSGEFTTKFIHNEILFIKWVTLDKKRNKIENEVEQLLNECRIVVSYLLCFVSCCIVSFWILIEVQQCVTNSASSLKSNQFFLLLFFYLDERNRV